MKKEKSIYETLKAGYNEGLWYDWFCTNTSLDRKGEVLLSKLKLIAFSNKFDINKTYVIFKNNCPMNGVCYDDFRVLDMKTGDVLYTIVPKSGHFADKGLGEVWGQDNKFKEVLFKGTWLEIKRWFLK